MPTDWKGPQQMPADSELQDPAQVLARLADVIAARKGLDPATSYVARLLATAPDAALKKIGEEASEVIMAAKDGVPERLVSEMADLWFHCLVALVQAGLRPEQVLAELARREGISGLDEKAARRAQQKT
jgi:phosphoribosyl-ATP pyrophosphohydrolase